MIRPCSFLSFLFVLSSAFGQGTSAATPMGVLVSPPKRVAIPAGLRSEIPKNSVVRLLQRVRFTGRDESVIVYDNGNQYEPHPHVAIVKNGKLVADFSLVRLFAKEQVGESYALFRAAQATLNGSESFIAAFRNIGDGAGTLFLLLTAKNGEYRVWKRGVTEGRLKILKNGSIQIWGAEGDGDCVWCPQHYKVETFGWNDGDLSEDHHYETKRALSPSPISEDPIVIEH